jgi:hypothetical protein
MPAKNTEALLEQLDEAKTNFDVRQHGALRRLLLHLRKHRFKDPSQLLRYHESLLFIRAYPHSASILKDVETELSSFADRVSRLQHHGADITPLETPENAGLAGSSVTDTFSYFIVRWLRERHPREISFYWDWFEDQNRLAETWPRFMPLLAEDGSVEANVPYRDWLRAARGRQGEVQWLIDQFERLPLSEEARAELYDGQKLYVTWTPPYQATRTGMKLRVPKVFYHRKPLIQRREVHFPEELERPLSAVEQLSEHEGSRILDRARETSMLRYRELYGFTHGDAKRMLHIHLGRGVDLFISGIPPGRRLPLRAYHAAMIFKNGVPVGYFEGLSLFERMESGFNLYYTFRDGETAWLYARTLNVFRQLLGVTTFSLDPYQIGHENEEGIESGAFWFYRKLGFRPTRGDLARLTEKEEQKIATRKSYRTPARVLRQLAAGPMVYEQAKRRPGDWDRFQLRNIGFAVARKMAASYGGDSDRFRRHAARTMSRVLAIQTDNWSEAAKSCFNDFAVVLLLVPDFRSWTVAEKQSLLKIVKAKSSDDESRYLKLMQRHERLRQAMIRLGSRH